MLGAQCSYSLKALILFWESHPQLFLFLVLGTGGERMSWVCLCGVVSRQRPQPGACVSFLSPPATTLYLTRASGICRARSRRVLDVRARFHLVSTHRPEWIRPRPPEPLGQ